MKTNEVSFVRSINKLLACMGLIVACFAAASSVAYANVAGHVQFINGDVQITDRAGQIRPAQKGDAINEGDTLTSAQKSSAQIKMQDGGFVAVRPDTKLKFDEFVFAGKEDGSEKSFFSLFKGGFRAVTGLIGRLNKRNYRINTPAATIGIRGTDHETFLITPDSPLAQVAPTGAYNRVNIGETSMTTDMGTIVVQPNQMGFAGGMDQTPQVQPVNINIFTVAEAPAPVTEAENKEENTNDSNQAGGASEGASGETQTETATDGGSTGEAAQGDATAAAPQEEAVAPVRTASVVDATAPSTGGAPAATAPATTTSTATQVVAPPPPPTTIVNTAPVAGGTTVNITTGTATTSTGQTIPVTQGLYATQAQTAANSATAAANAAATAAAAVATVNTQLAALLPVDTAPASTAITTANPLVTGAATTYATVSAITPVATAPASTAVATATANVNAAATAVTAANTLTPVATTPADTAIATASASIGTASPAVTTASGLAPADAALATANATAAQTAAAAAATQSAAAQAALTANGAFADASAAPANTATQNANSAITTANAVVQGSVATVGTNNANLTAAQAAAQTALTTANNNLTTANNNLATATTQNAALTAAQTAAQNVLATAQANLATANSNLTAAATQNAALTAAQTAAQNALATAQANLATANSNLTAATNQNTTIAAAQASAPAQLTAAQSAAAAAQTAAAAAQAAAAQATTLQAAGDLAGAQAQLAIAQQQLAIAQNQQAIAIAAQTAVTTALTNAQTAQTTGLASVTSAVAAATTAQADAATVTTQSTLIQPAATAASTAVTTATTAANTAATDAGTAQTQAGTTQTAASAAATAVTAATTAANTAATDAGTAQTQAAAAQTASTAATAALTASTTSLGTVNNNVAVVATNAPIAAYNNPAVLTADRFVGSQSTIKADIAGGYVEGFGPGSGFTGTGTANTNLVLDGAGNLVEQRSVSYEETPASTATSQIAIADANIKRTGGTALETYKMADSSIYAGRWVGGTLTITDNANAANTFIRDLGVTSEHWVILLAPPVNYVQTLSGTVTYTKVAATSPTDALGNAGVLNTGTLSADFTTQLVSATLNLDIAGKTLDVLAASMAINGSFFGTATQVTAGCAGCGAAIYYANVGGGFAGDAAAGAGLNYTLWTGAAPGATTGATDLIQGVVAFSADTVPVATPLVVEPYVAINTSVAYTGSYGGGFNFVAAPGDISPVGNPATFTERYGDGSGFRSDILSGASTTTPPTTTANGITFGVWETVASVASSEQHRIEPGMGGMLPVYMYGEEGYLDSPVAFGVSTGPLIGVYTYISGAATSFESDTWATGSVTATMSANFTTQTVNVALAGTMGANNWALTSGAMPINFMNTANGAGASFSDYTPTATRGGSPCATCVGNIDGTFVGQNYAGAIVQYGFYDNSLVQGMSAGGLVAFINQDSSPGSTPAPTGAFAVAGEWQLGSQTAITTNGLGVLTGWSSPNFSSTVAPAVGSVPQAAVGILGGVINWGTWASGSVGASSFSYNPAMGQFHWITAPEPTPIYLAEVLTTSNAVYNYVGGDVTSLTGGVHGTINGTTSITANFTTQTVAAYLALAVNGHNWLASTANAPLQYLSNGSSMTGFYADSYRLPSEPGYLAVTVDGTGANGNLAGQLVGAALDGAILKFNLDGQPAVGGYEFVQGTAALGATVANDPATSYRMVLTSISDPMALVPSVMIGGAYNNGARIGTNGSGYLTQFDNSSGGGRGETIQYVSGTFADQGIVTIGSDTISWGRWGAGTVVNVQDRATGVWQNGIVLTGGAHAVVGPVMSGPVALPTTGVYAYNSVGGTTPTTDTGAAGTLNSVNLQANFAMQTVNVGVNVTAGGATLDAVASNVPIQNRAHFFTDSKMIGPGALAVTCQAGACGTTNHGAIGGGFGGPAGVAAAITYGFEKGGVNAGTISGVAVFQQGAAIAQ